MFTANRLRMLLLVAALLTLGGACQSEQPKSRDNLAQERRAMVKNQISSRGVSDQRLLEALHKVERHLFVPGEFRSHAYADHPLPIGEDQTISQPYIVALMTELLKLDGDEKVLEIGTGSGYQAAVLSELATRVFTIEIVKPLAARSAKLLDSLGYDNVTVKCGDGYAGWVEHAPFDRIIVTCAPPKVPAPLIEQLADSGRMVVPVGEFWQELVLIEKFGDEIRESNIIPVRFVPMTGDGVQKDD
ncbi:MAG: protein-L-isoaspartate(D-aspartate) O-methyltransferase [candidate division Zixibacteria bacterium]|nr:protein-L-isoaspartate(D-aspartate) O-methyltransferase [candidate division Zixibacteria bacterium]MDH3937789.1 protein-L-isoaspartate(D-aspartate) O-methyltransferase [candidate division Zixibacteria bacterium]MDH4034864.1 protein-L-isoaspartate(D-aspartate) O-methyltransferase [candidate division Zixibacteria bacterium]